MFRPLAAVLASVTLVSAATPLAHGQSPDPAQCSATTAGGAIYITPAGTGQSLASIGARVTVVVRDGAGAPIPNYPASEIWLVPAVAGELRICSGALTVADHNTDASGTTTIGNSLMGGGATRSGLQVMVHGMALVGPPLPIQVNSTDITANGKVDLGDVAVFAQDLQTYNFRSDFDHDGQITLVDVGLITPSVTLASHCP
jgi:hypothetical protein